ncbi:hypothetical protein AAG570_007914 [Ranatra chinensis]|uniref:SH3 domain-containing protein n=1 Tax=Ranatra chinensis TaxID=642074 RepID=A0ABD0Y8H2_9HEMI
MAPVKVQALYDFTGEPGSAELTISAGEVLTVTRQDVGEGWWEGTNQNGQSGLFPAAYVENFEVTDYWEEEWDDDSEEPPQILADLTAAQYAPVAIAPDSSGNIHV